MTTTVPIRSVPISDEMHELVHDLRSPLAAIEAAAHAILDRPDDISAVRGMAALMAEEARCAQELIDRSLEGGTGLGSFPVAGVLASVAASSGTRWSCAVQVQGNGIGEDVLGDPAELRRALANLVDNAVQHGHCAAVTLQVDVQGSWLVVRVVGVRLPRQSALGGGTRSHGIGLQSVRRVVAAFGGKHEVSFDQGERVDEIHLPRLHGTQA